MPSHQESGLLFFILVVGRKEPTTVQQVLEYISGQKITVKYNKVHLVTACRYKNTIKINIKENRSVFNHIRHIQ